MSKFLLLPREIRDNIYGLCHSHALQRGKRPGPLQRSRKRIAKPGSDSDSDSGRPSRNTENDAKMADSGNNNEEDPETGYYEGEETVRYPVVPPVPSLDPLLATNHQVRAELLDNLSRQKINYGIKIQFRDDHDTLFPTWTRLPATWSHIHELHVELRVRRGKSSSVSSVNDDEDLETRGHPFQGGLMVLQRFLERGASFLSKKKARRITVDLLAIDIPTDFLNEDTRARREETFNDLSEFLDDWLARKIADEDTWEYREREDEFFDFVAQRIARFRCRIGEFDKEWDLKQVVAARADNRARQEADRRAATAERAELDGQSVDAQVLSLASAPLNGIS